MIIQKKTTLVNFSSLLSLGVLLLNSAVAAEDEDSEHRRLPCETACISNDDEDNELSQTDGIIVASLMGAGFTIACLCFCCQICKRDRSTQTQINTPLLQNTLFYTQNNIELPTSPEASTTTESTTNSVSIDEHTSNNVLNV